jgi:Kdo2-lipid IVA lauroyltransferase/acyltransferase
MRTIKNGLTFLGIGMIRLLALLPVRAQFRLGSLLGRLVYYIAPRRRHIAETNIALCFPELDADAQRALIKAIFRSTGISAMETAMAWFNDPEDYRSRVTVEGLEHLQAAQAQGRGVLLIGAHFATLDLAGCLVALFADFDVMYKRSKNPIIENSMRKGRERHFGAVIERRDTRQVMRRLRQGRTIWYAADQDYGRQHSVFAPFFGQQAATIVAASRLARLNDSPALLISHFRDERRCTWSLRFSPIIDGFPSGDDVADATCVNAMIEAEIRRHPEQYLWLHRRFKTRPEGEEKPYRKRRRKKRQEPA